MLIWFYLNVWLSFVVISPNMKFSKRRKKKTSLRDLNSSILLKYITPTNIPLHKFSPLFWT